MTVEHDKQPARSKSNLLASFELMVLVVGSAQVQADAIALNEDGLSSTVMLSGSLALPNIPKSVERQVSIWPKVQAAGQGVPICRLHHDAESAVDTCTSLDRLTS